MNLAESCTQALEISALRRDVGAHEALAAYEELSAEVRGSSLLTNPAVQSLLLDLEFLTHEEGTVGPYEIDEAVRTLSAA